MDVNHPVILENQESLWGTDGALVLVDSVATGAGAGFTGALEAVWAGTTAAAVWGVATAGFTLADGEASS